MNTQIDSDLQALRAAIKADFRKLYVKQFTTDWEAQRLVRELEIDVMDLSALKAHTEDYARKLCLEVIGEDEPIEGNATYVLPRNAIRATQRKQLDSQLNKTGGR